MTMTEAKPEDWGELGPAMRQLTERQRAFVRAYVVAPPGPGALVNSYVTAGYGLPESKRETLAKNAHHLSRGEKIIAAVREEATKLLRLGHPRPSMCCSRLCAIRTTRTE
jgi:hypothetical protein